MKELGNYLKMTRIENGVNLNEAASDMNISTAQLENIENGNTRAFKDVYKLKEYIRTYAKYLGLDSEKVIDQFNDFLFEHTSKLSLEDIISSKNSNGESEEKSKIKSPYTIIHEPKRNVFPFFALITSLIIVLIIVILVLIGRLSNSSPRTSELKCIDRRIEERL